MSKFLAWFRNWLLSSRLDEEELVALRRSNRSQWWNS